MKNRKFKFLMPLIASLSLSGCSIFSIEDKPKEGEEQSNVIPTPSKTEGYYKDYDLTLKDSFLAEELQTMCFDKHKNYIKYGNYNSYCSKASGRNSIEAVADGSNVNQWFYTGKEASGYGTREHVWPCANSDNLWKHDGNTSTSTHNVDKDYYVGGGSDLYHVRTANSHVNTVRGNSKFVDFDDPEMENFRSDVSEVGESKGKYTLKVCGLDSKGEYADKAEPADEMKGDIARILVYVWIHYADRGLSFEGSVTSGGKEYPYNEMLGGLAFTNIMGYSTNERCIEKLCEWNKMDPPSDVEKLRNNTVQKVQGNRNMFVDFPELMDQVFDEYL